MAETLEKMQTMIWNAVHGIRGIHMNEVYLHGEAIYIDGVRKGSNIVLSVILPKRQKRDETIRLLESYLTGKLMKGKIVSPQGSVEHAWTIEVTIPV